MKITNFFFAKTRGASAIEVAILFIAGIIAATVILTTLSDQAHNLIFKSNKMANTEVDNMLPIGEVLPTRMGRDLSSGVYSSEKRVEQLVIYVVGGKKATPITNIRVSLTYENGGLAQTNITDSTSISWIKDDNSNNILERGEKIELTMTLPEIASGGAYGVAPTDVFSIDISAKEGNPINLNMFAPDTIETVMELS